MTDDEPVEITDADAGYVAARLADDYNRCVRELLGMTVWLPVAGAAARFLVAQREGRGFVRAYTTPQGVNAVAGPDTHPEAAVRRPFSEVVRRWRSDEIGLVVNPDTPTELWIPPQLMPKIMKLQERMVAEARAVRRPPASTPTTPMARVNPPSRIGPFRFASMVDGVDEAGRPMVAPERPRITDPHEKQRVGAYLQGGEWLQVMAGLADDMFAPEKGPVVPASMLTDGTWIWSGGMRYYLDTYGIGPERDFYDTIVANGYRCPEVSPARRQLAGAVLTEHQRITAQLHREQGGR